MAQGDEIRLILDSQLEESILSKTKKKPVDIEIIAEIDKPIQANFKVGESVFTVLGNICLKAEKQPLQEQDFVSNFAKSDLFEGNIIFKKLESVFMPKQQFNEFRRNVFEEVYKQITEQFRRSEQKVKIAVNYTPKTLNSFKYVEKISENFDAENIIYSPENYNLDDITSAQDKAKQNNVKIYLNTPNFALENDIKLLKYIIEQTKIGIVANNYYALNFNTEMIIGPGLNVYNSLSAEFYDKPVITAESDIASRVDYPVMTLRHCPMKSHLNANCSKCPYSSGFVYVMENGTKLKLKRVKLSTCAFYLVKE